MSLILDALDCPEAAVSRLFCLSEGPEPTTVSDLATEARRASAWLQALAGDTGTVAALLSASADCLAVIFGALRAGITLVSVPHPARGMGPEEYLAQTAAMCAVTGASHLLVDRTQLGLLGTPPVPVHGFGEFRAADRRRGEEVAGRFVQFTSGSTGTPAASSSASTPSTPTWRRCSSGFRPAPAPSSAAGCPSPTTWV